MKTVNNTLKKGRTFWESVLQSRSRFPTAEHIRVRIIKSHSGQTAVTALKSCLLPTLELESLGVKTCSILALLRLQLSNLSFKTSDVLDFPLTRLTCSKGIASTLGGYLVRGVDDDILKLLASARLIDTVYRRVTVERGGVRRAARVVPDVVVDKSKRGVAGLAGLSKRLLAQLALDEARSDRLAVVNRIWEE